jgi:hypothetical protein
MIRLASCGVVVMAIMACAPAAAIRAGGCVSDQTRRVEP